MPEIFPNSQREDGEGRETAGWAVSCDLVWDTRRKEDKGREGDRKTWEGEEGWVIDTMISSDGGRRGWSARGRRREREGGCGTATVVWREYRKERRRKWENLINEIILQSTSISLHSAATVHMSRQPARQAGRGQKGVRIVRRKKDQRVDESFSVSLVITKVSARPSLFSASIITVQVGKSLHKSGPRLRRSHMTHRPLNRAAPAPRSHVRLGCNWVSLAAANCAKLFYSI